MTRTKAFAGQDAFLSNFYPAVVFYDGEKYPTVEHAYVAAKTLDLAARAKIRGMTNPGEVKKFGKKLQLRPNGIELRLPTMERLLLQKFNHPELKAKLEATGLRYLVEENWWHDNFWGQCTCGECGPGENNLGKLLMKIRRRNRMTLEEVFEE